MRYGFIVLWIFFWSVTSTIAQVSVGIALPGVSIGINMPLYPEFERVPGYPVYYAPRVDANFFFYDGMYWVYQRDSWYASSWYNGPWGRVTPEVVPLFVLRIPVRYYRVPPAYFHGWRPDAPPRWGEHWGNDWDRRRSGWDRWDRNSVPAPAPLPVYQRQYSRDRYPQLEQQHTLHAQNYRYEPRDAVVRQHYQEQAVRREPARSQRQQQGASQERSPRPQGIQRSNPQQQQQQQGSAAVARSQPPQRGGDDVRESAPGRSPARQKGAAAEDQRQQQAQARREQQRSSQESVLHGKGSAREAEPGQGQEKDREKGQHRGQDRNR